jgi:hypothetical protein
LARAAPGLLLEAPRGRTAAVRVARALDAPALEARRGRAALAEFEAFEAFGEAGVVVSGMWRGLLFGRTPLREESMGTSVLCVWQDQASDEHVFVPCSPEIVTPEA